MFETSKLDVPFLQGADRWSFMPFMLLSSSSHVILVFLSSWHRMIFSQLFVV